MSESWDLPEDQPDGPESPRLGLLVLLALCLAVMVLVAFFLFRPASLVPFRQGAEMVSVAERLQLDEAKNEALQQLVRENFDPADQIFSELALRLPDEPLGLQNLAICRLLALEAGQIEPQIALGTANQLVDVHSEAAVAHVLAARVYRHLAGSAESEQSDEFRRTAVAYLRRAVELEPSSRMVQFTFYEVSCDSSEPAVQLEGRQALSTAFRLDPQNLFVLLDWMKELVATQDRRVTHILQGARTLLVPFRQGIRSRAGVDMFELIDRAAQGALAGQWDIAETDTRRILEALADEELVQSDRRRAQAHPLKFLVHRFSDAFYAALPSPPTPAESSLRFRFKPFPAGQQPPPLSEVRDLVVADIDRDGTLDLVILRAGELLILCRATPGGPWSPVLRRPVPEGLGRLLLMGPRALLLYGEAGTLVLRVDRGARPQALTLTQIDQVQGLDRLTRIRTAASADLDGDGKPDLVIASDSGLSLWANRGELLFADISDHSGLPPADLSLDQISPRDWEHDGDVDLICMGPSEEAAGYLENLGHGHLRWQSLKRTLGPLPLHREDLALIEVARNDSWDVFTGGKDGLYRVRMARIPPGFVVSLEASQLANGRHRLLDCGDLDRDGYPDLLVATDSGMMVFNGGQSGGCGLMKLPFEGIPNLCRVADLDADGDLDLAVVTADGVVLYANQTGRRSAQLWRATAIIHSVAARINSPPSRSQAGCGTSQSSVDGSAAAGASWSIGCGGSFTESGRPAVSGSTGLSRAGTDPACGAVAGVSGLPCGAPSDPATDSEAVPAVASIASTRRTGVVNVWSSRCVSGIRDRRLSTAMALDSCTCTSPRPFTAARWYPGTAWKLSSTSTK